MRCILIGLFCITITVGINGAWLELPILVDQDASELTRLAEEFWSLKPTVFLNKGPLVLCQVIDQCCASEDRLQAISLMATSIMTEYYNKKPYSTVLNTCMKSTVVEEASQSCPLLHKLMFSSMTKQEKSDIFQYKLIILNYFTEFNNLINHLHQSCNGEELHALVCSSNTVLVKTCVTKILEGIYDDSGYTVYQEFINENKQTLINVNQELIHFHLENPHTN